MPYDACQIDVCIPTWNSGKILDHCLKSIVEEISINGIKIVDSS
jgi:glycosyltransferase involved in cell wall biosynthesis